MKKIKSGTILSEKKANKKTFNEPKIDAKDEYLDRKKIIIQDNPKIRLKLKDKAKTIQELDREKLEKKFSKDDKEKLN